MAVGVRFEPTDHTEYKSPSFLCVFAERRPSSSASSAVSAPSPTSKSSALNYRVTTMQPWSSKWRKDLASRILCTLFF